MADNVTDTMFVSFRQPFLDTSENRRRPTFGIQPSTRVRTAKNRTEDTFYVSRDEIIINSRFLRERVRNHHRYCSFENVGVLRPEFQEDEVGRESKSLNE